MSYGFQAENMAPACHVEMVQALPQLSHDPTSPSRGLREQLGAHSEPLHRPAASAEPEPTRSTSAGCSAGLWT